MSNYVGSTGMKGNQPSSSNIASFVARNASLASSLQLSTTYRPGGICRQSYVSGIDIGQMTTASVILNRPVLDMTTRGVMAQKGFIDLDESDMGWIIAEAIKEERQWHSGPSINIGLLSLFTPLAAATGFLLSEYNTLAGNELTYSDIQKTSIDFLENTTPEDTVHFFTELYSHSNFPIDLENRLGNTLSESVETILDSEIHLKEFYQILEKENLSFKTLAKEYEIVFTKGISAIEEGINENLSLTDSILHTYLTILALEAEPLELTRDKKETYKILRKAKEIIDFGGYVTPRGRELTEELNNYTNTTMSNYFYGISDITSTITFIALLQGIRP